MSLILETTNYATGIKVLKQCFKNSLFCGITGPSGVGKTFCLKDFLRRQNNVFYIEYRPSMTNKKFFSELHATVDPSVSKTNIGIHSSINQIALILDSDESKKMIIIDEAGEFSHGIYRHLKELRNLTYENTSIVLSGPDSYKDRIEKEVSNNVQSMDEFKRRINLWVNLPNPPLDEKKSYCRALNLKDEKLITKLSKKLNNFGSLKSAIDNIDFLRENDMLDEL